MESYLQQNERTWVRLDELERAFTGTGDKNCIATIAEVALDEGGHRRFFFFNEDLRGKEVADAARFAGQARNDEEMERMAG